MLQIFKLFPAITKNKKNKTWIGYDFTDTCGIWRKSTLTSHQIYVSKNWRTGFWSVQYQQQQRKGIFNPLNTIHIHSASQYLCMLPFISAGFSSLFVECLLMIKQPPLLQGRLSFPLHSDHLWLAEAHCQLVPRWWVTGSRCPHVSWSL